jgi:hypothetical protein
MFKLLTDSLFVAICRSNWLYSRKYGTVWYHPASSRFYLIVFILCQFREKLTGTLLVFDTRATCVKPDNPACCVLGVRCWFYVNRVDPPAIDPYQQYIDYLEDVVIYNLKWELSEVLASPDPSSSVGEDRSCKCFTCTCERHKKDWSPPALPPPPHRGTTRRRNTLTALWSSRSFLTTRFIRHVVMKFLNSLRHVISM